MDWMPTIQTLLGMGFTFTGVDGLAKAATLLFEPVGSSDSSDDARPSALVDSDAKIPRRLLVLLHFLSTKQFSRIFSSSSPSSARSSAPPPQSGLLPPAGRYFLREIREGKRWDHSLFSVNSRSSGKKLFVYKLDGSSPYTLRDGDGFTLAYDSDDGYSLIFFALKYIGSLQDFAFAC
jgi:hypothetical protein